MYRSSPSCCVAPRCVQVQESSCCVAVKMCSCATLTSPPHPTPPTPWKWGKPPPSIQHVVQNAGHFWSQWSIPIICSWCSCIKPWEKRSQILPLVFHSHLTCNMLKTHPTSILFCVLGKQHHASSTSNSALLFSNSNCASRSSWRDAMLAWFWVSSGRLGARNSWNC